MAARVAELTDHIGYRLRQVSNHVSQAFARKVAGKGVTVAEWALMRVLYGAEPLSPSQAADAMGMTRGAITKLADRLISKVLLTRHASTEDGRAQTLRLTAKGARLVPELAALADRNEVECFAHLSAADRRTLTRILSETSARLELDTVPVD